MLRSLQYKRFTTTKDELLSSIVCYWYVQANRSIEPIGNDE